MLASVGTGWVVMTKLTPEEVPPPGVGLFTVTSGVPALAISAALIAAVSCVELTKVVVRAAPFQRTTETPSTKPLPFTVSVKPGPWARAVAGAIAVAVGAGLVTERLRVLDVPPPGADVNTFMV